MRAAATIIVMILAIALVVIPILPSQSYTDTTKTAEILGHQVATRTDTVCSPSSTSILAIFLKGLKTHKTETLGAKLLKPKPLILNKNTNPIGVKNHGS